MALNYGEILRCAADCRFTDHARREMETEPFGAIRVDGVLQTLQAGEIIERYPQDKPYPSCLVFGRTAEGRPLHIVCAPVPDERKLIIVTVYQPDPARWDAELKRRDE